MGARKKNIQQTEKSFLRKDEASYLDRAIEIRKQMLDLYIEEKGIPTDTKSMRIINEVVSSLEEGISKRATMRQRAKEVEAQAVDKNIVFELLRNVGINMHDRDKEAKLAEVQGKYLEEEDEVDIGDESVLDSDPIVDIEEDEDGVLDIDGFAKNIKKENWLTELEEEEDEE